MGSELIRISIISGSVLGGAGVAALNLHEGLLHQGYRSHLYTCQPSGDIQCSTTFEPGTRLLDRIRRFGRRFAMRRQTREISKPVSRIELFSSLISEHGIESFNQCPESDIYHFHWVNQFADIRRWLRELDRRKKHVVWTLHDMNVFTGGCHYDAGCGRHARGCGHCPQLGLPASADFSRRHARQKRDLFTPFIRSNRLHVIAPSKWLADEASRSEVLYGASVSVIPNVVNTDTFRPLPKPACREALQLSRTGPVLLFVSGALNTYRKGFDLFLDCLAILSGSGKSADVLLVGEGSVPAKYRNLPGIRFHQLGRISNQRMLCTVYNAADVHVIPTRADNLPYTVLEAMSCGTPSVGFQVGGLADMIRPGITGDLAVPFDVAALARAVHSIIEQPVDHFRGSCREIALTDFSPDRQVRSHMALYGALCQ